MTVRTEVDGPVWVVTLDRPEVRNAIDRPTAEALADAFRAFEVDEKLRVAVLTGAGESFCAGADLKGFSEGRGNRVADDGDGPLGPTRMVLDKPVIAAIEGHAVAGGLELAIWCDLRVAARDAIFGVYCRRFGVPLIDGGTIRLPRLIGHGRAMDLILTGRGVGAEEALGMGLVNRVVAPGQALSEAVAMANQLAELPQRCMLADRRSAIQQWDLELAEALRQETLRGLEVIASGETLQGAQRFARGQGRGGKRLDD